MPTSLASTRLAEALLVALSPVLFLRSFGAFQTSLFGLSLSVGGILARFVYEAVWVDVLRMCRLLCLVDFSTVPIQVFKMLSKLRFGRRCPSVVGLRP